MNTAVGANQPYLTLNDGNKMPMVGLGTFLSKDPEELETVLKSAILEKGYRHIDCAQGYGNEDVLGRVLKYCFEQGIKREDLFIVTKCLPAKHDAVEKSLEESLEKLQLTYVDLYLVHHMCPKIDGETWEITGPSIEKVWKQFETCKEKGLTRSIGISNCPVALYLQFYTFAKILPAVNQIEVHPYFQQELAIKFFQKKGMAVTAFSPINAPGYPSKSDAQKKLSLFDEPVIVELSQKYQKTAAQIILNWNLNRNVIVIPKTTKVSRLAENFDCYDFKMTEEEYQKINELEKGLRNFDPEVMIVFGKIPFFS